MPDQEFSKDTSSRTWKDWAQGLLVLLAGLTIAHLGVTLFLLSEMGADTFTVLIQGISRRTGLSIGTCHVAMLVLLMAVMLLTTKGYVKPGTVVCAFCGGWIIDFFLWVFGGFISTLSSPALRVILMLAGCVILGFGMSIIIKSNSGTGPNDLIAMIFSDKINQHRRIAFRWVRIGCDVFFVAVGFFLGGTVGIGTVVAALLTGPVVQFFLPLSEKIIQKLVPRLG